MLRRDFIAATLAASVAAVVPFKKKAGAEFFVRDFWPDLSFMDPAVAGEEYERTAVIALQRAAKSHGYTKVGKLKYHPIVWDSKRGAWDVVVSAVLT